MSFPSSDLTEPGRCMAGVRSRVGWRRSLWGVYLAGPLSVSLPASAASIVGLGDLPGGDFASAALGLTVHEGVVRVVGASHGAADEDGDPNGEQAFHWTPGGGMVWLPGFSSGSQFSSQALGISRDGSTVVGFGTRESGDEAVRLAGGTPLPLGRLHLDDEGSYALGVSGDGGVVVGYSLGSTEEEAFRWTASDGLVGLGYLSGANPQSGAHAITDDGSVVVGYARDGDGNLQAVRWEGGTVSILADLPGGDTYATALGLSPDGSTVVGYGSGGNGVEAVRWREGEGPLGLGDLGAGEFNSRALGVSADGRTVVGVSKGDTSNFGRAFLWTEVGSAGLMSPLMDVLLDRGADLSYWRSLLNATAISPDGRWVVGTGINVAGNTEAFLVDLSAGEAPVGEGGSVALLMGLAAAGLGVMGGRRVGPQG